MKKKYFTDEERREAKNSRRRVTYDKTLLEKFYVVDSVTGCWNWIGCKWSTGYGYTRIGGKHTSAHRYMYAKHKGTFDPSLDVCHSCDNPSCVNPDHLWLGTHSDNMKDMYAKNRRSQKGAQNGNYKGLS